MVISLKIGELAKLTGSQIQTIRYYEREGLLAFPNRSSGNYRLYDEEHIERLSFIRHCRSLDMTLEEIRALLKFRDKPESNCGEVNHLLDEHIQHVADRLKELKELQKQLKNLRQLCEDAQQVKHCGILNELAAQTLKPHKKRGAQSHVDGIHRLGKS
jgi:Cd(II)/Pb(II)-responsive transcriptional regulator